jgi:hypothetical protein
MASSGFTPFTLPINHLAQLGGAPGSPANVVAGAAALVLNPNDGAVVRIDGDSAVSATIAITTPNFRGFGGFLVTIINASGAGTVTATFGSGFLPTATVAPTTGKAISVLWVSDGIVWREVARSASAQ